MSVAPEPRARSLDDCVWVQSVLSLRCERTRPAESQSLVFVLRSLFTAGLRSFPTLASGSQGKRYVALRVEGFYAHQARFQMGDQFAVTVTVVGEPPAVVDRWLLQLRGRHENYTLMGHTPPTLHSLSDHEGVAPGRLGCEEVMLEYQTLVAIGNYRVKELGLAPLDAHRLLAMLAEHVSHVFELDLNPPSTTGISVLLQGMRSLTDMAPSKSEGGSVQHLNGWVGRLYLQGSLAPWLPWLALASAVNGMKYSQLNPLGALRLHVAPSPFYESRLFDAGLLREACADVCAADGLTLHQTDEVLAECEAALLATRDGHFRAHPTTALSIPKLGSESLREIEQLSIRDRVLVQHVRIIIETDLDRLQSQNAHAYRKNHSVQTALQAARDAITDGRHWVIRTDIEQFFPTVRHELLFDALGALIPHADEKLRALLYGLVSAPMQRGRTEHPRFRGLAQGSPLSPMLANFYLAKIDQSIEALGARLVRYADDMLILAHSPDQLQQILIHLKLALQGLGLTLDQDKTTVCQVDEGGVSFLGQRLQLDATGLVVQPVQAPQRRALILTRPGLFVHLQADAIEVRESGRLMQSVPLRGVSCVLALGQASFSQHFLERSARARVPVVLRSSWHRAGTSVVSLNSATLAHFSKHFVGYSAMSEAQHLAVAIALTEAKILNKASLIEQEHRKGGTRYARRLRLLAESARACNNLGSLRGVEGPAATLAFDHFRLRLADKGIPFGTRDRSAGDRVNAALNFGYHLLSTRIAAYLTGASMSPYLGHFHDSDQNYETLVYDLMEPFRAMIDKLVLNQFLSARLDDSAWLIREGGERMTTDARRAFVLAFEEMLHKEQPGWGTLASVLELQVEALKNHVLHLKPLWVWHLGARSERRVIGAGL